MNEILVVDPTSIWNNYSGLVVSRDADVVKVWLYGVKVSDTGAGFQYFAPSQLNRIVKTAVAFV